MNLIKLIAFVFTIAVIFPNLGSAKETTSSGTSTVVAETSIGPITLADLERQIRFGQGLDDDREKSKTGGPDAITERIQAEAYDQILLHLATKRGMCEEPGFKAELELMKDDYLLRVAYNNLIDIPSQPEPEVLKAYVRKQLDENPAPLVAAWRYLLFEIPVKPSMSQLEESFSSATRAHQLLLGGESFETVAAEIGSASDQGTPPGAVVGPVAYGGKVFTELERILNEIPIGEISDPTSTPLGAMIVKVENRYTPAPTPRDEWQVAATLLEEKKETYKKQFLEQLRDRYDVTIILQRSNDHSPTTPLVQAGNRVLTYDDLRTRAQLNKDPEGFLRTSLTTSSLHRMADDLLLLCVMDETGVTTAPETEEKIKWRARFRTVEEMQWLLNSDAQVQPSDQQLAHYLERNSQKFITPLLTGELLTISITDLADTAGSTYGLHMKRAAEHIKTSWLRASPSFANSTTTATILGTPVVLTSFHGATAIELPKPIRTSVTNLETDQATPVTFAGDVVYMFRLDDRQSTVPALEKIRPSVAAAYSDENTSPAPNRTEMLRKYDYRQVIPSTKLFWDPQSQTLTIKDPQ